MRMTIPGELWNLVPVPTRETDAVNISTYLSEVAYKLASIRDVMVTKEFWHTACEFAERCGALRERTTETITKDAPTLEVAPTFGSFQRLVGAGIDGSPVAMGTLDLQNGDAICLMFADAALSDDEEHTAYADASVVPETNATPDKQILPKWFLKLYGRALLAGTLMRLYAMDGEQWTDAVAARMHATTFIREVNRITHGLITAGMRRHILIDAESILARQSSTTNTTSTSNTVG